jgi:hypothetical protein
MGSEPERDDSGLPPLDIEIPDDARELDRDVQAYYRELRARRRHWRVRRLITPLTRHGMVVPLVAGMLAVTLVAGSMLTFVAGTPGPSTAGLQVPSNPPSWSVPPDGQVGGELPNVKVLIGNKRWQLRDLSPSVLTIVPNGCRCLAALRQLSSQAAAAQIGIYFVGTGPWAKQLAKLARQVGQTNIQVIDDPVNVLGVTYHPDGLTAILVHSDSAVTSVERDLMPGLNLQAKLGRLGRPGVGFPPSVPASALSTAHRGAQLD